MEYEPMTREQLQSDITNLRARLSELEASEQELRQLEDLLQETRERFLHLIENTVDSFFVVGEDARFIDVNERACESLGYSYEELLKLSVSDIDDRFDEASFQEVSAQLVTGVPVLEERTLRRKDGATFPAEVRVGLTMLGGERCMLVLARDLTERKQAEEARERLGRENAVLAEVGRIISSTLDIDEVYPRFAEEVRKLIPFDRIVINLTGDNQGMGYPSYIVGTDVPGRRVGTASPVDGTVMGEAIRNRSAVLIQGDDVNDFDIRFPRSAPVYEAGIRSFLSVPLISGDKVIGALNIRSHETNAYAQRDVELAERIGSQIAGAIANSLLYSEIKRVEEANDRLAQENAVLAEIGRVISSTLDIDEAYPRFAEEAHRLIPFDRIVIALVDEEGGTSHPSYVVGIEVPSHRTGAALPLDGTVAGEAIRSRSAVLIQGDDVNDIGARFPRSVPIREAGIRSFLSVPLISGDKVIGVLNVRSHETNAYAQRDVELAERIGDQIAGAIANSILHSERRRAEETSERLARENAVLAEVGRIISSSLDIDQVYERFTQEVGGLIPFDRIVINLCEQERNMARVSYIVGVDTPGLRVGEAFDVEGSITGEAINTQSGVLIQENNTDDIPGRFPGSIPVYEAGLRSFLFVPLISSGEVIGALNIHSCQPNAYTQRDLELAKRIGSQIAGAVANSHLYSELKRADEALKESESRFRQLAEHMPEVFWLYDFESERVLYVNPAYQNIFHTASSDLYENKNSWMESIHPDDRESVRDIYENHRKEDVYFEFRLVRTDGSIRWISNHRTPVRNEAGEVYRLIGIAEDITDRKLLEERLLQSQKLESIGRLAGGVAHDFNNLLTPIIGYAQMAMRSLSPDDNVRTQLQHIYQAAERASNLIRQLLTFSSRQIIEPKVMSLSRMILDMDNMLRRLIGEDIELITRPKSDLGLVKVDPGQMEQVLVNLAVNARDAMPDSGRLIIEADDVEIDQRFARSHPGLTPGRYVMMAVRDNGIGMMEEVRARIFEPFFTTKERGKGTGLGLSTCYGIVKQSGGHILVDSEPGQGTTFRIYLPRVEGVAAIPFTSEQTGPLPRGTETVLLVEDEVSVREIVAYVLREQGYTVYEAVNGRDALRIAQGHVGEALDLLVTDVVMPGMGGAELVNQLKPLCPQVRVLFISGYTEDDVVNHGMLERGAAMLLQKPFTPTELAGKVREALDAQYTSS